MDLNPASSGFWLLALAVTVTGICKHGIQWFLPSGVVERIE
jgi:hypothetical protein